MPIFIKSPLPPEIYANAKFPTRGVYIVFTPSNLVHNDSVSYLLQNGTKPTAHRETHYSKPCKLLDGLIHATVVSVLCLILRIYVFFLYGEREGEKT